MARHHPPRQIHLDFHTSEHITDIGGKFDAEAFADTLVRARVASVQLFARCWHGWMYYQSARFAERIHPHLNGRDMLREQIVACNARGIATPIYVATQVDRYSADRHLSGCNDCPTTVWESAGVSSRALEPACA